MKKNKEKLKKYARNCYFSKYGTINQKNIMKTTKNKHDKMTEISLKKKKI